MYFEYRLGCMKVVVVVVVSGAWIKSSLVNIKSGAQGLARVRGGRREQ